MIGRNVIQITKCTKQTISGSAAAVQTTQATNGGTPSSGVGGSGGTQFLELCADTACFIAVGPHGSTVATTSSTLLPANVPRLYACNPGDDVSVIGTSGNLYVTEGH
jgi:hypothetical protein